MRLLNDFFGEYKISFDPVTKVLYINEKIPVKEFIKLKRIAYNFTKLKIKDIKVGV